MSTQVGRVGAAGAAALAIFVLGATTAGAVEGNIGLGTFAELRTAQQAGASFEDFCGYDRRLQLKLDGTIVSPHDAEVLVVRVQDGFEATVLLDDDVASTKAAVFAVDPLLFRTSERCSNPLAIAPVTTVGAEGLSVIRDQNGNLDFYFKGRDK